MSVVLDAFVCTNFGIAVRITILCKIIYPIAIVVFSLDACSGLINPDTRLGGNQLPHREEYVRRHRTPCQPAVIW